MQIDPPASAPGFTEPGLFVHSYTEVPVARMGGIYGTQRPLNSGKPGQPGGREKEFFLPVGRAGLGVFT